MSKHLYQYNFYQFHSYIDNKVKIKKYNIYGIELWWINKIYKLKWGLIRSRNPIINTKITWTKKKINIKWII
jgi:hypothetical protein